MKLIIRTELSEESEPIYLPDLDRMGEARMLSFTVEHEDGSDGFLTLWKHLDPVAREFLRTNLLQAENYELLNQLS